MLLSNARLFHLLSCTKEFIKQGFTLGKAERLKSRKLMEQLFQSGQVLLNHPLKLFYTESTSLQAGFGVSSRTFKKATDRNRIKRLLREAYRLQKQSLENSGAKVAVFILYTGKELPAFDLINKKLNSVLQALEKKLAAPNDVK